MSEDRTDRRIAGETHVDRINGWAGSDSWIQGCRRDPEEFDPVPDQPRRPYRLHTKAYHGDRICRAGELVWLWPPHAGENHAKIGGVDYPDEAILQAMRDALPRATRPAGPERQPRRQLRGV